MLASRTEAVAPATSALFPHVTTRSTSTAWDGEGWLSGRAAADRADLSSASGEVTE